MTWTEPPAPTGPGARLAELRWRLGGLGRRVRQAAAEAVAEALSGLARDAAGRLLRARVPDPAPKPAYRDAYGRPAPEDDPWQEEAQDAPDPWRDGAGADAEAAAPEPPPRRPARAAAALALRAAGWYLRHSGRLAAALLAGAACGLAALAGGPAVAAALDLAGYAGDLLALDRAAP
jgi:hypothetical protein